MQIKGSRTVTYQPRWCSANVVWASQVSSNRLSVVGLTLDCNETISRIRMYVYPTLAWPDHTVD